MSSLIDLSTHGNRGWIVKVSNTKESIMKCITIASEYNDYNGVIKMQNSYYLLFNGYSEESAKGLRDARFQVSKLEDQHHNNGLIIGATYIQSSDFSGFAMTKKEIEVFCKTVYKNGFIRNKDLRKPEIDHVDNSSDTIEQKKKKTGFYIGSCIALMKTLPSLIASGNIKEANFDIQFEILKDRIEKLKHNMDILIEGNIEKQNDLHPYIKWNQIEINISKHKMLQITVVEVLDPPTMKLKMKTIDI